MRRAQVRHQKDTLAGTPSEATSMPRRPRLEIPGLPLHITQRGVNRAATFIDDGDFVRYRDWLGEALTEHRVALHAYALMGNHVHLLATPHEPGALARVMRQLGQRYVPAFNRKHGRTGTLWEGRFKSCLVDSDRYLLSVLRYIELNPVRAAIVERAEQYRWSSVHVHLGLGTDPCVAVHPAFLALGCNPRERALVYRQWLHESLPEVDLANIRRHLRQERALGSPRFQALVEKTLNRPVAVRSRGRPRKPGSDEDAVR